jgi:hypothetical protein
VQLCTVSDGYCGHDSGRERNELTPPLVSRRAVRRRRAQMASIYDTFADSCAALAAKTKRESDKVQLLQLANQWRTVPADRQGPGRKPLVPAALASATENPVPLLARPAPQAPVRRPKSASDRIKDRKKQLESKPKRGKEMALVRAREAIGVLRELEIDTMRSLASSDSQPSVRQKRPPPREEADWSLSYRSRTASLRRRALPLTKLAKRALTREPRR